MKLRDEYTCPLEMTHDITKGKWKPIILWQLGKEPFCSFSALIRSIKGITEKMLMEQLSKLLSFDMISKKSYEGYPLKVEYSLTERGKKMLQAISIMQEIGIDIMREDGREDFLKKLGFLESSLRKSK
jgi:DNA-binding HxlR family transcriptional regulator